jgi:uncharacterized metal-binding protein YceD (DUF177 family)
VEPQPEHTIAFQGLKDGAHAFDFVLGPSFFKATGVEDFLGGQAQVHVVMDKNSHLLVNHIHVDGYIDMLCDHCNAPMQQVIRGDQRQVFKLSAEDESDDDELVSIDPNAHEINLTHYIFECISLHLPIRHIHPAGQCDPEVEQALNKVLVHTETGPDPRWAALDKLKKKKA